MNMVMGWLLKFDGYPPSVVVALLLHGVLLWLLLPTDFKPRDMVSIEAPVYISATLSQANPQQLRRIEELDRLRREQAAADRAREEARQRDQRQVQERTEREARERAETERRQQAEARARQQQQDQAAAEARRQEEARATAAREEAERQEAARQQRLAEQQAIIADAASRAAELAAAQSAENNLVAQYIAIIKDAVSRSWSVPPSAQNGMVVIIRLQLVPTGEVVSKLIIQSSGDDPFDRAALQAVDRAGSFPELRDMPIAVFERNFRNFNLQFRPEDLLR
jgi:colicin import membrane protein